MKFRRIRYIVCPAIIFALAPMLTAIAVASPHTCPEITMLCISDNYCCGPKFEFVAQLSGGNTMDKISYKWSVSAGRITSGQGTSAIKVDMSEFGGYALTATVELVGLATNCVKTASISQSFCEAPPPTYRFFDSYGEIAYAAERQLLDKFALQLREDYVAQGYILVYNGRGQRAERAKKYLTGKHKIKAGRIKIVEGGSRQGSTIELYIVPPNVMPPSADMHETLPASTTGKKLPLSE